MFTINSFYLAAIIQGLFLISLLLFNRKGSQQANRFLALLVCLLTLSLWNIYVRNSGLPTHWKLFDYHTWATPFLWGPTLYFYVKVISLNQTPNNREIFRHCSIFLIIFLFQLPLYLISAYSWLEPAVVTGVHHVIMFALYIQLALYLFSCFQVLKTYDSAIKNNYSYVDSINLIWLKRLLVAFAVLLSVDMATTVPGVILQQGLPYLNTIMIAEAATIYLIGYFSLSQAEIIAEPKDNRNEEQPKYRNSPLDTSLSNDLIEKLNSIMRDTKIYQKNDLRLADLAQLVGISPHHLSQIINEQCQSNFYDYVNRYRVELAADSLLANGKSNIANIAFDAGFNNRASFNSAFKKYKGMTPSQYKREHQPLVKVQPNEA